MGKSTLFNPMRETLNSVMGPLSQALTLSIVSSDECTKKHLPQELQRLSDLSAAVGMSQQLWESKKAIKDSQFQNANKKGRDEFKRQVDAALKSFKQKVDLYKSKNSTQVAVLTPEQYSQVPKLLLILDKNHPENAIGSAMDQVKKSCPPNVDLRFVALLTNSTPCTVNRCEYPFSLDFLYDCIDRVMRRTEHGTLTGYDLNAAIVVVRFFKLFERQSLDDGHLSLLGFQRVIRLAFVKEGEEQEGAEELSTAVADLSIASSSSSSSSSPAISQQRRRELLAALLRITPPFGRDESKVKDEIQELVMDLLGFDFTRLPDESVLRARPPTPPHARSLGHQFSCILREEFLSPPAIVTVVPSSSSSSALSSSSSTSGAISAAAISKFARAKYAGVDVEPYRSTLITVLQDVDKELVKAAGVSLDLDKWKIPNTLHLTCAFFDKGRVSAPSAHELFGFCVSGLEKEPIPIDPEGTRYAPFFIRVLRIVIVPERIMTSIILTDAKTEKGRIPHVTLGTQRWAAAASNDALLALQAEMGDLYSDLTPGVRQFTLRQCRQETGLPCFVVTLPAPLHWGGPMKFFF
eukprot:GILI01007735.1.p1 GENE.GILI01007735.1~~GILI01007735.1.p1  ORF type:complete len:579 (+),score=159.26 GILI01007735.1:133-1869(+)